MRRPFSDKRPIGPFGQGSRVNGVVLVYTTDDINSFPPTGKLERLLDTEYQNARDNGRGEVVAADPEVEFIGDRRSDTRGVKVDTGVTIMNMEQFEAVKEVTTQVIEDVGGRYSQIAVAVPNP